jgi:putative hemolysin
LIYILLIAFFILFVSFFTSTEIALISANPIKIRHQAKIGNRRAKRLVCFFLNPEDYIATILVGTNLFIVATTVVATRAFSIYWGVTGKILTTFIISFLIMFFGEIVPKSLSILYPNKVALSNFSILRFFHFLFLPFSWVVRGISQIILFRVRGRKEGRFKESISKETLIWAFNRTVIGNRLRKIDKSIFTKIFHFSEKPVSDIMVPRVEIKMIGYPFKIKEVLRVAEMTGLSRFPVYRRDPDKIIGILTLKDVFTKEYEEISRIVRPVKFVPPNKRCDILLGELKDEATQMAIVVNEYGETEGLVTLEDLVEALFGEIVDEFDLRIQQKMITRIDEKKYGVSGLTRISEINEVVHLNLPEGDYDTISGFIMDTLKELPAEDSEIVTDRYRLIVDEMEGQKVKKVIIEIFD